jgi:hypothetical protein
MSVPISRGVLHCCKRASTSAKRCLNIEVSSSIGFRALFLCEGGYMHSRSWSYDMENASAPSCTTHSLTYDAVLASSLASTLSTIQYGTRPGVNRFVGSASRLTSDLLSATISARIRHLCRIGSLLIHFFAVYSFLRCWREVMYLRKANLEAEVQCAGAGSSSHS